MDRPTFHVGDLVMIADEHARPAHRGVVYRVTRKLPVNLELDPAAGGRQVRAHPQVLVPAPPATDPQGATVVEVPYQPPLAPGQIVTVTGPGWRRPPDELYVVLKEKPDTKVSIAKLGGDNGRYWPSIPRRLLTVIDADRITTPTGGS